MSETEIVKSCLDYLALKKVFAYRSNTGAFQNAKGGFYRFGAVGSSDIIAIIGDGKYLGIEVKNKGRQTENQKLFQQAVEKAGGLYWLVRSLDDLIIKLKDFE